MTSPKDSESAAPVIVEETRPEEASIERLLDHVPAAMEAPAVPQPAAPALRTARVVAVRGAEVQIAYRGRGAPVTATIDEGVDRELVKRAMAGNEAVLVEVDPEVGPVIVGVVQTRVPDELEIKARKVVIDAEEELTMRAGRGAMRIREDGDVELVGSRISTMSRGLFRIVGRVLRLN
jgi:hypothetical protein